MVREQYERVPRVLRLWMGRHHFGRMRRQKLQRAARRSQARRYPGDWVFERIDGDGETFDFGIDMTECGIVKFLNAQGPLNSAHTSATSTTWERRRWGSGSEGPRRWPGAAIDATSDSPRMA
jgi:hypothetical protein